MSLANRLVKIGQRNGGLTRGNFGNDQIWSAVAMMMVTAAGAIAGLVIAIAIAIGVLMMLGMRVLKIVDCINRETGRAIMVVRDHQSRRVLDLVRRFGRNGRRIEQHERNAERGNQTVHCKSERVRHDFACNRGCGD